MGADHIHINSKSKFPTKLTSATAVVSCLLVGCMGFEVLSLVSYLRSLQDLHFPVTEQSGLILSLDERLTLVTYLKANSDDPRWKKQHEILMSNLDIITDQFLSLTKKIPDFKKEVEAAHFSRQSLNELERDLINSAQTKEAANDFLAGSQYLDEKQKYQALLFKTINILNQNREALLSYEQKKALGIFTFSLLGLGALFIPAFFLLRTFLKSVDNELNTQKDLQRMTELQESQKIATAVAHQAGMAEIATGILHNIGNILNSVNVGAESMLHILRESEIFGLLKANELLSKNLTCLADFLLNNPKGAMLPQYYISVGESLDTDFKNLNSELGLLIGRIQLIKDVISSQQAHAKGGEFKEEVFLAEVVETALTMQLNSLMRHDVQVMRRYHAARPVLAQKVKLVHVLLNLIKNAKEAMVARKTDSKQLVIEVGQKPDNLAYIKIKDNGEGIAKENLNQIFAHGYTTKKSGHGFGLHYCANALTEMDAQISVNSDGVGLGTTFTIVFSVLETSKKTG